MASFSAFNLSPLMVNALKKMGYVEPSPVQSAVIPKALRGESLLAQSATGSGKTHAYLVPVIEKTDTNLARLQSIIVAPTRELARQTFDFARAFTRFYPHLKIRLFSSEDEVSQNQEGLSQAPQIVIGTPGRLKDILVDKHSLDTHNVRSVVLDEADMLLELGFFPDIEAIFTMLKDPQTLVFSATLKQNLRDELHNFVRSDFEFEAENTETASTVSHHLVNIKHTDPKEALVSFLKIRRPYLCIVFASKKDKVKEVYDYLVSQNFDAILFTGSLSDRNRKKAIREIRANNTPIIVASDILSRGIDIPDVSDVVSIDLPSELEFYYHRAGRTGRFGKTGDSWVFYDDDSTRLPLELLKQGTKFDFYSLRDNVLKEDPVGLLPKKKLSSKKAFISEDEIKDVKLAKARTHSYEVKPAYKKKRKWAIEKVKKHYRRKAIQKSVRREVEKKWKEKARKDRGIDD
jgi:ATP-dependent RNA helicase CshB